MAPDSPSGLNNWKYCRVNYTDIAIVKLNKGLRYTNHTFGTAENPGGIGMVGISSNYPPRRLIGDIISMDNPYSGFCEGPRGKNRKLGNAIHSTYLDDYPEWGGNSRR